MQRALEYNLFAAAGMLAVAALFYADAFLFLSGSAYVALHGLIIMGALLSAIAGITCAITFFLTRKKADKHAAIQAKSLILMSALNFYSALALMNM